MIELVGQSALDVSVTMTTQNAQAISMLEELTIEIALYVCVQLDCRN